MASHSNVPKSKAELRRDKRLARLARRLNPIFSRFRVALVYSDNKWRIATKVLKSNRVKNAHVSGAVEWSLKTPHLLPLDDNLVRGLIDGARDKKSGGKKKVKAKARRYISPKVGIEETFRRLNEAGVKYAVLRWFDTLPHIEPCEDIDMLVADEAAEMLDAFFQKKRSKGAIPCDIYSESGLKGTDFQGLPYYEKRLATALLDNTVLHKDLVKVPSPKYHFLSLAYHVLYHKAHASGLAYDKGEPPFTHIDEHDYAEVLSKLAQDLGISVNTTLIGLREALEHFDWNPSIDSVRKLALKRPVLNRLFERDADHERIIETEVSTFIIRKWAFERNLLPWILANIRHFGFDVKLIRILTPAERGRARLYIRGGNWNRGPYPVSGGEPAAIVAICDYAAEPVSDETLRKQPYVKSERLVDLKRVLRDGINNYLPDGLKLNPIHSADDQIEALHYLEAVDKDLPEQFISQCKQGFTGDPYTKLVLHRGKRATTYIVFRNGKPCILKVFSECEDGRQSLFNEIRASQTFAGQSWFPEVYETGPNWVLQEYFAQSCRFDRQVKKMDAAQRKVFARKIVDVIAQIHKMGFAHRDIHGGNFFIVNSAVKLIDYETLIEEDKKIPLAECYDITGKGLASPFLTAWMCYENTKEPSSLKNLLGISAKEVMNETESA